MVLVGGFGAHQLDFRLGVPVGGNGSGLAGRGAGHGAIVRTQKGSSAVGPMAAIAEGVRLRFALQTAFIPPGKLGFAVSPEVQLGPDPMVLVIKRQAGSPV